jgi:signal transduction histidine kinase
MLGEEHYQRETLTALLRWTIRIGPIAALLNMLGFLADPAWTTVIGSAGVVVLVVFAWWCLRLVRGDQTRRAARTFIISGMCIMAGVIFIAAKNEVLLGAMGMGVFVVIATFFEPPRAALRWGALSGLLYEAGFLARNLDQSRDLGLHVDIVSLYIVPPVILCFLALAGRIINQHLTHALNASEAAARDLARSYAEVELRVAERTRELAAARDQAEAANRAKSTFLANMSHELRTPLTTILGYTDLIEHYEQIATDPRLLSDLDSIRLAGNHLLELISDVLDFARLEAGDMELHPQLFDIATLIDEAASVVRPAAAKNDNTLDIQCDRNVGALHLDAAKVRQILINLLSNAAKFTEHGTITLTVRRDTGDGRQQEYTVSRLPSPVSDLVVFEVTDTGIGIAPDQLPWLFHPFAKGDIDSTRAYSGTGLGLAICQRFCELMGGELAMSSQPGHGSTFSVRLPVEASPPVTIETSDAVSATTPTVAPNRPR